MVLAFHLKQGWPKTKIAEEIGVHRSTLYRELVGNTDSVDGYIALIANRSAIQRKKTKPSKLQNDSLLRKMVIDVLKLGWSPEQIDGRLNFIAGFSSPPVFW